MKKAEFITERTRILSEMLDNEDDYGIYPTTKFFNQLDELFDKIVNDTKQTTEPVLNICDVSVSFADFLLTHKQSDEVQKATAHQLFKEFIEAYEL